MTTLNANLTRMPEVSVLGFPALFTPHRVSQSTVHFGLYQYELQGDFNEPKRPIIVTKTANEDFCGTLLSFAPLLLQGAERLILDPGDIAAPTNRRYYSPAQFEQKYYRE